VFGRRTTIVTVGADNTVAIVAIHAPTVLARFIGHSHTVLVRLRACVWRVRVFLKIVYKAHAAAQQSVSWRMAFGLTLVHTADGCVSVWDLATESLDRVVSPEVSSQTLLLH
jgi:hypothetical protein